MQNRLRTFIGSIALLLAYTGHAAPPDVSCVENDKSFRVFLARFADDRDFQSKRIVYPLVARFGRPPTTPIAVELWGQGAVADFKAPVLMSRAERRKRGIEQKITVATEAYAEAYHFKPEADSIEILYLFRKYEGCWFLEAINDTSL